MITTVYEATNEDLMTFHRSARRPVMVDWLKVNGINPGDVPLTTPITVEESIGRKPIIRYWTFVRDEGGNIRAEDDEPVTKSWTTPLVAPVPKALIA